MRNARLETREDKRPEERTHAVSAEAILDRGHRADRRVSLFETIQP